ncbi:MAG: ABC transporter permease [Spirochaetes bacterium]|nr:ABC transporter permease [Spirochaetota bacterium]
MFYILRNIALITKDSIRNIFRTMISSFGIIILIAFVVMYIPFRESVKRYLETNIFGKLAINEIVIYPPNVRKNNIITPSSSISGEISAEKIRRIAAFPEIQTMHKVVRLDFKTKLHISLFGYTRYPYVPICGVSKEYLKGKIIGWQNFKNTQPVPIVAPKLVIEMLNEFLVIKNMPPLEENALKGLPLNILIFEPPMENRPEKELQIPSTLLGFADVFPFPTVLVPSEYITSFAEMKRKELGLKKRGYKYIMAIATVKEQKYLPEVARRIQNMGLVVESQQDIASKTNKALEIIDRFSYAVIGILLFITIISIFNSYLNIVYIRSYSFSLKRIIGVSKLRIILEFVLESAIVGTLLGAIGFFLGDRMLSYASQKIGQWIPALRNIVVTSSSENLLWFSIFFSIVISSLSALLPAIFASNINLFKASRK